MDRLYASKGITMVNDMGTVQDHVPFAISLANLTDCPGLLRKNQIIVPTITASKKGYCIEVWDDGLDYSSDRLKTLHNDDTVDLTALPFEKVEDIKYATHVYTSYCNRSPMWWIVCSITYCEFYVRPQVFGQWLKVLAVRRECHRIVWNLMWRFPDDRVEYRF